MTSNKLIYFLSLFLVSNLESFAQINELGYIRSTTDTQSYSAGTLIQHITYPSTGYTRSVFSSNPYWDTSMNKWRFKQMGANDGSAIVIQGDGGFDFVIHPSSGNFGRTMTHSEFKEGTKVRITKEGNIQLMNLTNKIFWD